MKPSIPTLLAALLLALSPLHAQAPAPDAQVDLATIEESLPVPPGLPLRARVTSITPEEPTAIEYRHGGEGLGGSVIKGYFPPLNAPASTTPIPLGLSQWSAPVPLTSIVGSKGAAPKKFFLTIKAGKSGKAKSVADRTLLGFSTNVTVELEFSYNGKVIKTITDKSPDGPTMGILIPFERLSSTKTPESPDFTNHLVSLLGYASQRAEALEALPWSKDPLPKRYAFMTDLGGYGQGANYGVRHNDPAVIDAEARALRQIGVNGLRAAPDFLLDRIAKADPAAIALLSNIFNGPLGFPVPRFVKDRGVIPEAGCPYAPGVPARTQEMITKALTSRDLPVKEVWTITVDEIGAVVDMAPEGKPHLATCDLCAQGYRDFLKSKNVTPQDFGKSDWSAVRPLNVWNKDKSAAPLDYTNPHIALGAYYSKLFINHASAKLYTPLRQSLAKYNQAKIDSASTDPNSPQAKQPSIYSYALRGNTFLLGGHSLDFFEFYRLADNAFVYETSNRDPRVWQWDSYLCDVGRSAASENKLAQGIYVKPHRGAPLQRALTAIARGCTNITWYTYGPDYAKGDCFSELPQALELCSKAAHIIAKAEDSTYGSKWANPAQIAIVKPFSSEIWLSLSKDPVFSAAWENAKWTHTGLTQAHLPVDALDETLLTTQDLSKYKVICYMGPTITRAAAADLSAWVSQGGTLYTSGYGLSRDEANQPLDSLLPVLGLTKRQAPTMYRNIPTYAAGALENFSDPKNQLLPLPADLSVSGSAPFASDTLKPVVARETLFPAPTAKVLAKFSDQSPAVVMNQHGKGKAYTVGFFPGLEYIAPVLDSKWDMSQDLSPAMLSYIAGPALSDVKPPVQVSSPNVEAVHLRHPTSKAESLVLMNWAYRVAGEKTKKAQGAADRNVNIVTLAPVKDLKITFTTPITAKEATSTALGKSFPITQENGASTLTLPSLQEGDILLLK
jgi:hypothetical protein